MRSALSQRGSGFSGPEDLMESRAPLPARRRAMPEHEMSLPPVSRMPAHHRGPASSTLWVGQVSCCPSSHVLQPVTLLRPQPLRPLPG